MRTEYTRCEKCQKVRYRTRKAAKAEAKRLRLRNGYWYGVYQCPTGSGFWHLTSGGNFKKWKDANADQRHEPGEASSDTS